jgi:aarF domain-containing kinase
MVSVCTVSKFTGKFVDIPRIMDLLLQVHAHELFFDGRSPSVCDRLGFFNGDPHPGNILLMPDGRLGLIDYGQVKALPLDKRSFVFWLFLITRILLARMIVALADNNKDEIVRVYLEVARVTHLMIMLQMGIRTARNDPYVLEKLATIAYDRDDRETCEGLNLQGGVCC